MAFSFCQKRTMLKAWLGFCLIACLVCVHAEDETHAWTFAEAPGADGISIEQLSSPSVFAGKGDRLLDFSKLLKSDEHRTFPQGTWLVWNTTRHLLIAHGSPRAMEDVQELDVFSKRLGKVVGSFGWHRGIAAGAQVAPDRHPDNEVVWTGRPGSAAIFGGDVPGLEGAPAGLSGRVGVDGADWNGRLSLSTALEWIQSTGDQALRWKIETPFSLPGDSYPPTTIAWGSSATGEPWALTCLVSSQWLDGTPVSASRWVEVDGKAELVPPLSLFAPKALGVIQAGETRRTVKEFAMPYRWFLAMLFDDRRNGFPSDPRLLKKPSRRASEKPLCPSR